MFWEFRCVEASVTELPESIHFRFKNRNPKMGTPEIRGMHTLRLFPVKIPKIIVLFPIEAY